MQGLLFSILTSSIFLLLNNYLIHIFLILIRVRLVFIILLVILLPTTTSAQENVFYVDKLLGSCEGDGRDEDEPWSDFDCFNINDLPDISTIYVSPGVYTGAQTDSAMILIKKIKNITIKKNGLGEVIFDGSTGGLSYGIFGYMETSNDTVNNVVIEGITFRNFQKNSIKFRGNANRINPLSSRYLKNIKVKDCVIEQDNGFDTTNCALLTFQLIDSVIVESCSLKNIITFNNLIESDGIYIDDSKNIYIMDNFIEIRNDYSNEHIDCIQVTESSGLLLGSENILIERNKIFNNSNYINNRQGIYVLNTTGFIKVYNNLVVSAKGKGLVHIYYVSNTNSVEIFNNTLVGKENNEHLLECNKNGGNTSVLNIKNNIFYKNVTDTSRSIAVKFLNVPYTELQSSGILNNNLYCNNGISQVPKIIFGSGIYTYNYLDWWEDKGLNKNPVFTNPNTIDFTLSYGSPCKNKGVGLLAYGIEQDLEKYSRPYWDEDFDIGAYEIEDTQLKISVSGVSPGQRIIHTLTSVGPYWERNNSGSLVLSSDQTLQTAYDTTTGNSTDNLDSLGGMEYKWLDRSDDNTGQRIAAGFYKVTNDYNPDAYFYLDLRDAVTSYSPNIYIKFDASSGTYSYRQGSNWTTIQYNGTILRIWDINSGTPNTGYLSNYWKNALVIGVNPNYKPLLSWGPKPSFSTTSYKVYRALSNQPINPRLLNFSLYYSAGSSVYSILDPDITIDPTPDKYSYYFVRAYNGSSYSDSTNIADTAGDYLPQKRNTKNEQDQISFNYALNQNYPNPFNPATRISFSIAKADVVTLRIYDCLGREVKTLVKEVLEPGNYIYDYNAESYASGIYFCRITAGSYSDVIKMQLLK